jgi:hypothetical protein
MSAIQNPMNALSVLDAYFIENRARLLEIAAFLDRVERTRDAAAGKADFRYKAFQEALRVIKEEKSGRAKKVQLLFSDLSPEPLESAAGMKSASGAWKGGGK